MPNATRRNEMYKPCPHCHGLGINENQGPMSKNALGYGEQPMDKESAPSEEDAFLNTVGMGDECAHTNKEEQKFDWNDTMGLPELEEDSIEPGLGGPLFCKLCGNKPLPGDDICRECFDILNPDADHHYYIDGKEVSRDDVANLYRPPNYGRPTEEGMDEDSLDPQLEPGEQVLDEYEDENNGECEECGGYPEHYDFCSKNGSDDMISDGDYVRDTQDGPRGEIFKTSQCNDRRCWCSDNSGRGWFIPLHRLVKVKDDDRDLNRYFPGSGDDIDESEDIDETVDTHHQEDIPVDYDPTLNQQEDLAENDDDFEDEEDEVDYGDRPNMLYKGQRVILDRRIGGGRGEILSPHGTFYEVELNNGDVVSVHGSDLQPIDDDDYEMEDEIDEAQDLGPIKRNHEGDLVPDDYCEACGLHPAEEECAHGILCGKCAHDIHGDNGCDFLNHYEAKGDRPWIDKEEYPHIDFEAEHGPRQNICPNCEGEEGLDCDVCGGAGYIFENGQSIELDHGGPIKGAFGFDQLAEGNSENPLVDAVKKYALEHYEDGGWDYVIEAWEDSDIEKAIQGCKTPEEAIKAVGKDCGALDAYRKDIQGWGGMFDESRGNDVAEKEMELKPLPLAAHLARIRCTCGKLAKDCNDWNTNDQHRTDFSKPIMNRKPSGLGESILPKYIRRNAKGFYGISRFTGKNITGYFPTRGEALGRLKQEVKAKWAARDAMEESKNGPYPCKHCSCSFALHKDDSCKCGKCPGYERNIKTESKMNKELNDIVALSGVKKEKLDEFTAKGHNCDNCDTHLEEKNYAGHGSWSYKCPRCRFQYSHNGTPAKEQIEKQVAAKKIRDRRVNEEWQNEPNEQTLSAHVQLIDMADGLAKPVNQINPFNRGDNAMAIKQEEEGKGKAKANEAVGDLAARLQAKFRASLNESGSENITRKEKKVFDILRGETVKTYEDVARKFSLEKVGSGAYKKEYPTYRLEVYILPDGSWERTGISYKYRSADPITRGKTPISLDRSLQRTMDSINSPFSIGEYLEVLKAHGFKKIGDQFVKKINGLKVEVLVHKNAKSLSWTVITNKLGGKWNEAKSSYGLYPKDLNAKLNRIERITGRMNESDYTEDDGSSYEFPPELTESGEGSYASILKKYGYTPTQHDEFSGQLEYRSPDKKYFVSITGDDWLIMTFNKTLFQGKGTGNLDWQLGRISGTAKKAPRPEINMDGSHRDFDRLRAGAKSHADRVPEPKKPGFGDRMNRLAKKLVGNPTI